MMHTIAPGTPPIYGRKNGVRTLSMRWWRRLKTDRRGVTLAEICVALLILSFGLVSILALFPKGIHSTKAAMDITTGSMIARSAMAILLYQTECNVEREPDWDVGSDWPTPIPGTCTTTVASDPSGTNLTVSDLSWSPTTSHFVLITSGRERGRLFPVLGSASGTSLPIGVDAANHQIEQGDSLEIIGPNYVGPVAAIVDDNLSMTLYSWIAVVGGAGTGITRTHKTFIFVYGRDYVELDDGGLTDLEKVAAINNHKPAYHFAAVLSEQGT